MTRLIVTEEAASLLAATIDEWKRGCQIAVEAGWNTTSDAGELQSITYDRIRTRTALKSEHTLLAIRQAASSLRSAAERQVRGLDTSKPRFTSPTIKYDGRTLTVLDDGSVTLTTIENRVRCQLLLPAEEDGFQYEYLNSDRWELTESTLTIRDGEFFLHLGFRCTPDQNRHEGNGTVLGVDVGIENLAVTSTGRFFSGRELNHKRRQYERRRSRLQTVGTRSAKRTLRRLSHREQRDAADHIHCIAADIVSEASRRNCSSIAFEELSGIRTRLPDASAFHVWAFEKLVTFVQYKAEEAGIMVGSVDPAYTSQACSRLDCGSVSADNRPILHEFDCQECGYQIHADYNAAKNIALKYIRSGHTSSPRMGVGQCALKSGNLSLIETTDKSRDQKPFRSGDS